MPTCRFTSSPRGPVSLLAFAALLTVVAAACTSGSDAARTPVDAALSGLADASAARADGPASEGGAAPRAGQDAGGTTSESDDAGAVPACSDTCGRHVGTVCGLFENYTLCTCLPRSNTGSGKWDCSEDWHDDAPGCAPGTVHGQPCAGPLTRIDDACMALGNLACHCGADGRWRCQRFPEP